MKVIALLVVAALPLAAAAQRPEAARSPTWVTLGTMGGPVPSAFRSQPANLLMWQGGNWLVDAGDGAVEQLAKARVNIGTVNAMFFSHLHFDHTGGLAALIGLRYQTDTPGKLQIYGPPGTAALVAGIVASMLPAAEAGYGLPGEPHIAPADTVAVHELRPGEILAVDGATVRVAQNSHYSFAPGSDLDRRFKSYSYRFDMPGRSIVYTGDTGPSDAVAQLGKGADVLVSEMIDVDATVATIHRFRPDMTPAETAPMLRHLVEQHLSPASVGALAAAMGPKQLVVTHFVAGLGPINPAQEAGYIKAIGAGFSGPIAIAHDLDRF